MTRDNPGDLTIRNQRRERWPAIVACLALFGFWVGVCVLVAVPVRSPFMLGLLVLVGGTVIAAAVFALVVFLRRPIDALALGDTLVPRPGELGYAPDQILRITFAPDPDEDYIDSPPPAAVCEVRVVLRAGGSFRLIATVDEARRLRAWAAEHGVEVVETGQALGGP